MKIPQEILCLQPFRAGKPTPGKAVHKAAEGVIKGTSLEKAFFKGWTEADFHKEVMQKEIRKKNK